MTSLENWGSWFTYIHIYCPPQLLRPYEADVWYSSSLVLRWMEAFDAGGVYTPQEMLKLWSNADVEIHDILCIYMYITMSGRLTVRQSDKQTVLLILTTTQWVAMGMLDPLWDDVVWYHCVPLECSSPCHLWPTIASWQFIWHTVEDCVGTTMCPCRVCLLGI